MGIEKFMGTFLKDKNLLKYYFMIAVGEKEKKINPKYLFLDFNSIFYKVVSRIENEKNYILYANLTNKHDQLSQKYDIYWKNRTVEQGILEYTLYEVNSLINLVSDKELILFISFDGIPSWGKIIEQRRRRTNMYIISKIYKIVYQENINNISELRKKFDEQKFKYDINNIICVPEFIEKVSNYLKENIKFKIIIDPTSVKGEAEMKIINYILENKIKEKIVIYSPDSDVLILSLILSNKNQSNIFMLHYAPHDSTYNLIYIDMLKRSILEYLKFISPGEYTDKCIDDLCLLFTLFGNDFIPKIKSIVVDSHLDLIMKIYTKIYNKNKFLIKNKIDFNILYEIIKLLAEEEDKLLYEKSIMDSYKNANFLKKQLHITNIYEWLEEYVRFRNNPKPIVTDNNIYLLQHSVILENNKNNNLLNETNPVVLNSMYKQNKFNFRLQPKKKQVNMQHIQESIIPKNLKIEKIDEIYYRLEKLFDLKKDKASLVTLEVNNKYIINKKPIKYEKHTPKLISEYIKAFDWIYKYYYTGSYDETWAFGFRDAPTLKELEEYLRSNKQDIKHKETKYNLSNLWHYVYITPKEKLDTHPFIMIQDEETKKKVKQIVEANNKIFPNLDYIAEHYTDINEFDCSNAHYLGKCIPNTEIILYDEYMKIVKD